MSDPPTRIGLAVPVHNRRETTLQCLRSLARIDASGLEVQVFVVDDGSTDGTAEAIANEFPEVVVITGSGDLHYAAGTNRAMEAAMAWGAEFVVAMNDDAVFHEQFLQRLMHTASAHPGSVVGALLLLWNEPHKVFQVAPHWNALRAGWTFPNGLTAFNVGKGPFEVEGIVGNCVLIPAEAIRQCGMLDEARFPHGWGDAQYFARLKKKGWRLIVDPTALVWCEPNTYPAPLHTLPLGKVIDALFRDQRHPQNLSRQFMALWESAPSKPQAIAAFGAYVLGLARKSITFGAAKAISRNAER